MLRLLCPWRLSRPALPVVTRPLAPAVSQWVRQSSSRRHPTTPYSKSKIAGKKQRPLLNWTSFNDKRLVPKYFRHAERTARELGVVEDIATFDEAAAAFPNQTPIYVATLLERANVIMRDVHDWEADFLDYQTHREDVEAKQYPQAFIDMLTASTKVIEGGGGGEAGASGSSPSASGSSDDAAGSASASSSSAPLSAFYSGAQTAAAAASDAEAQAASGGGGLVVAPRTTPADDIGDTRSLDRAFSQRLVLLVRDAVTGAWGLPEGVRLAGEPMVQAAQRCLHEAWGPDPSLDVWYIGGSPVGHMLRENPPDVAAATGTFGAKVFIYRAEIIAGRFRLPAAGGGRYSDFGWYTRDEAEAVLARPQWKYLHQVMAAGAGEEYAREAAWRKRVEARGLTVAQATGRRAYRVNKARLGHAQWLATGAPRTAGYRMPAIATRAQAAVAALPWKGDVGARAAKARALVEAGDAFHARVADQRKRSAVLRRELATPTAATVAALRRQQKRDQGGQKPKEQEPVNLA